MNEDGRATEILNLLDGILEKRPPGRKTRYRRKVTMWFR
jgi:hypothetical protein